jgi:hypothetical protein
MRPPVIVSQLPQSEPQDEVIFSPGVAQPDPAPSASPGFSITDTAPVTSSGAPVVFESGEVVQAVEDDEGGE